MNGLPIEPNLEALDNQLKGSVASALNEQRVEAVQQMGDTYVAYWKRLTDGGVPNELADHLVRSLDNATLAMQINAMAADAARAMRESHEG